MKSKNITVADQEEVLTPDVELEDTEGTEPQGKQGLESFVFMDQTKKVLEAALATEQNVVLYGKGGYGKSEYTIEWFKSMGITPYVITMGTGMTTERLLGGFDVKEFNDSGKMNYLVENSFMNHEFVVFEELFDAPDFILEQLKDILSSGVFRNGSQQFVLKTRLIVCCTNKTREEFAKNTSLKALMERFPLEFNVQWKTHSREDYAKLLISKLGVADPFLTYVLNQYHINNATISPRIALAAAEILASCGIDCLEFIADFSTQKDLLKSTIAKYQNVIKFSNYSKELDVLLKELKVVDSATSLTGTTASNINTAIAKASRKLDEIEKLSVEDDQVTTKASLVSKTKEILRQAKRTVELLQA